MERYVLFGAATGIAACSDYMIQSDDLEALKVEALARLRSGYTAAILDRVTGEQVDLDLLAVKRDLQAG